MNTANDNRQQESELGKVKKVCIVWVLFFVIVSLLITGLNYEVRKQEVKISYLEGALISEYETTLSLMYSAKAENIGLGNFRQEWIDNPCHKTAEKYIEALKQACDELEKSGKHNYTVHMFN